MFVDRPLFRLTDPDTSVQAADQAARQAPAVETLIMLAFGRYGPMTDEMLVNVMQNHYGPTVKTARSRLTKSGKVVDTCRRTRNSRNRMMVVWDSL